MLRVSAAISRAVAALTGRDASRTALNTASVQIAVLPTLYF
jgi:hypothetical protein